MVLKVQDNVLQARPVCPMNFPAETPAAFGLLQSNDQGTLTWVAQFMNALVPAPNRVHYLVGQAAADGSVVFAADGPMELQPYASKAVFAVTYKVRSYNSAEVSAIYGQNCVTYDPSQPLDELWSAGAVEQYGNDSQTVQISLALQRTVSNSALLSFTGSGVSGNTIEMDVCVFGPTGIPLT